MNNAKWSLLMAQRLAALRKDKGLSHEKLGEELYNRYKGCNDAIPDGKKRTRKKDSGATRLISKDSLINYEVSDNDHSRAYTNLGMSVEYLCYLADFYGVSTDYLLGRTDVKTAEKGVEAVCESTKLSENASATLCRLSKKGAYFIDSLLNAPDKQLEKLAHSYFAYDTVKNGLKSSIDKYAEDLENLDINIALEIDELPFPKVQAVDAFDVAQYMLSRDFIKLFD